MIDYDTVKDFIDYVEYYPNEDEPGFDGVHYGGMKGLKSGVPESAVTAWNNYIEMEKEAEAQGIKL